MGTRLYGFLKVCLSQLFDFSTLPLLTARDPKVFIKHRPTVSLTSSNVKIFVACYRLVVSIRHSNSLSGLLLLYPAPTAPVYGALLSPWIAT